MNKSVDANNTICIIGGVVKQVGDNMPRTRVHVSGYMFKSFVEREKARNLANKLNAETPRTPDGATYIVDLSVDDAKAEYGKIFPISDTIGITFKEI